MTSAFDEPTPAGPPPEPPAVWWSSWPLRERPRTAAAAVAGLAAAAGLVWWATGKPALAVLALAALAVPLWRLFLPASYEIGPDGVSRWVLGRKTWVPWAAVRRHEIHASGVLLFPDRDRCPLDALRAMYVPWAGRREEVLAQIGYHLDGGESREYSVES